MATIAGAKVDARRIVDDADFRTQYCALLGLDEAETLAQAQSELKKERMSSVIEAIDGAREAIETDLYMAVYEQVETALQDLDDEVDDVLHDLDFRAYIEIDDGKLKAKITRLAVAVAGSTSRSSSGRGRMPAGWYDDLKAYVEKNIADDGYSFQVKTTVARNLRQALIDLGHEVPKNWGTTPSSDMLEEIQAWASEHEPDLPASVLHTANNSNVV